MLNTKSPVSFTTDTISFSDIKFSLYASSNIKTTSITSEPSGFFAAGLFGGATSKKYLKAVMSTGKN